MTTSYPNKSTILKTIQQIDQKLSKRFIKLDPNGYFLVKLDRAAKEIVVEHFSNDIDSEGTALDPDTGEPLSCKGGLEREPVAIYRGRTAKELGIELTEGDGYRPISSLDHALYMGRELQRAELCLIEGSVYIQD